VELKIGKEEPENQMVGRGKKKRKVGSLGWVAAWVCVRTKHERVNGKAGAAPNDPKKKKNKNKKRGRKNTAVGLNGAGSNRHRARQKKKSKRQLLKESTEWGKNEHHGSLPAPVSKATKGNGKK